VRKGLKKLLLGFGLKPFLADIADQGRPGGGRRRDHDPVGPSISARRAFGSSATFRPACRACNCPPSTASLWLALFGPALLISVIGFVESVSVAQTLAAKKRQRIDPDQELIGLGASNIASAFSGGYPVTGGFARSVVNFDAGAEPRRPAPSPPSASRWRPCS
jgi:SulP family sulfate permease